MEDLDTYIGLWLRDVPYVWLQTDDPHSTTILSGHIRKYILPKIAYPLIFQRLSGEYTDLDSEYILPFSNKRRCGIEQLRMFMVYDPVNIQGFGMWVHSNVPYEIRVNGRKVNIPKYLTSSTTTTAYDVYDVLGLRFPNPEKVMNWQTSLMIKLTEPQPPPLFKRIRVPTLTLTEAKKLKAVKDVGELHRRWLDSLLLRAYKINGSNKAKICAPMAKGKGYESFAVIGDIRGSTVTIRDTQLLSSLKDCSESKVVLVPILWNLLDSDEAHMNLLVIVSSIAYIFDPWGSTFLEATTIKRGVKQILKKTGLDDGILDVVESERWCPKLSFQTLEGYNERAKLRPESYRKGFCVVWVLWMIETLLINPDIPPSELPRLAIQRAIADGGSLRETIEAYSNTIQQMG